MSLDNENGLLSTIQPQMPLVVVQTPSPVRYVVHLDNLPWFEFQVLFYTFLKKKRSMGSYLNKYTYLLSNISIVSLSPVINDCSLSLDHFTFLDLGKSCVLSDIYKFIIR